MRYLFDERAGDAERVIEGDSYRYLFKVRRHRVGETIVLRNLRDGIAYSYRIEAVEKKRAVLRLIDVQKLRVAASRYLHIAWCVIDPKRIEKQLPSLNEMGVSKLSFIYCERSQKDFRLDAKRLEKILLNSSQQSGRSEMMQLAFYPTLDAFLQEHPETYLLDFAPDTSLSSPDIETVLVGCEGGFTEAERRRFTGRIVGFDTPLVLRSESSACAVAAKLLL